MTKTCKSCGEKKPIEAFEPRRAVCRACRNAERSKRRSGLSEARTEAKEDSGYVGSKDEASATVRPPQKQGAAFAEGLRDSTAIASVTDPLRPLKEDFRKLLWLIWKHLNLPPPTPAQLDIASYMQHGPNKKVIEAFRGIGKSFITAAYVLWLLLRNPQVKILVVSASKLRADNFTTFVMNLIETMEVFAHLRPKENQRQSKVMFDVGPAAPDQSPSVMSLGITSQITGTRADVIIADDVEVPNNSATSDMREKLIQRTKEFSAVIKPLPSIQMIYLGTPQTEDSIYNKLPETFETRVWPAEVPSVKDAEKYGGRLAPYIQRMVGLRPEGTPTDPERFNMDELIARQAEYGKAGYALQFMLNTQLSDLERYPLKVRDLIITAIDPDKAPMVLNWMPDPERVVQELPNLAMTGDRFYHPRSVSDEFKDYTGSVLAIDPAGRGKDETGYAVVKMLNGFLFVRRAGGLPGGYDDATLERLAEIAKEEKVNHVIIESNFGDGMFTKLFQPVLNRHHRVMIEEVRHSTQKERRIIDTLEPVMARHKLIIDPKVIEDDYHTVQAYDGEDKFTKSLIYQMTRITYDRGALKHDDRLDVLAIAVAYWVEQMSQDEQRGIEERKQELLDAELRKFMDNALGHTPETNSWIHLR